MLAQREQFVNVLSNADQQLPGINKEILPKYEQYIRDMEIVSEGLGNRNKRPAVKLYLETVTPLSENIKDILTQKISALVAKQQQQIESISASIQNLKSTSSRIDKGSKQIQESSQSVDRSADNISEVVDTLNIFSIVSIVIILVIIPLTFWSSRQILTAVESAEQAIKGIAHKRDLTLQLPEASGEIDSLLNSFESLLLDISGTLSSTSNYASKFKHSAKGLVESATVSANHVHQQEKAVGVLYSALTDLNNMAISAAEFSTTMNKSAHESRTLASEASDSVNKNAHAISELSQKMKDMHNVAAVVAEKSLKPT